MENTAANDQIVDLRKKIATLLDQLREIAAKLAALEQVEHELQLGKKSLETLNAELKKLQEEGEMGRQKINQWTRYLTVGLAGVQTSFVAHWLQVNGVGAPTWGFLATTVLTLTTGTIFVMWLGEQITDRGVGNGISLLIFAGIVIGLPRGVVQVFERVRGGDPMETLGVIALVLALVAIIAFIVFVEAARRKVPVSYAKRHVGRQMVGGQQTTMPLKVNMGGVIPVIFASSVLSMPQSLFSAFPPNPNSPNTLWAKVFSFFRADLPFADHVLHLLLRVDRL